MLPPDVSLKQRLVELITLEGPMNVAEYMARCLLDPQDGYYTKNVAIGVDGDFITAPMVSQIFGEMIGIWVVEVWNGMGQPSAFRLVEVGGGDGTLMSDVLRVIRRVPGMAEAARVTLIEPSPVLRIRQTERLSEAEYFNDIDALPCDQPIILIANEVLDCLPARQFVHTGDGWRERLVGLHDGELAFGLAREASQLPHLPDKASEGDVAEVSVSQVRFLFHLRKKLQAATGAALLIDYGRDQNEIGDTLQALHRHDRRDPLEAPGEHDLTVWANFQLIDEILSNTPVKYSVISTQYDFLARMGAQARHDQLVAANPGAEGKLIRQFERLMATDQMGTLFKVGALAFPSSVPLPGLETASRGD